MKEGKIFDDVTSGVSQLASKVGWAPPYVQLQLVVPMFPCAGTKSGPGPPLSSDVRGQAGALVPTARERGDGWMAGTAPNLSLLSLYPLAAADRPLVSAGPLSCGGCLPAISAFQCGGVGGCFLCLPR